MFSWLEAVYVFLCSDFVLAKPRYNGLFGLAAPSPSIISQDKVTPNSWQLLGSNPIWGLMLWLMAYEQTSDKLDYQGILNYGKQKHIKWHAYMMTRTYKWTSSNIWDMKYYSMQLSLSKCKLAITKWYFCFLRDVNCEYQREMKIVWLRTTCPYTLHFY